MKSFLIQYSSYWLCPNNNCNLVSLINILRKVRVRRGVTVICNRNKLQSNTVLQVIVINYPFIFSQVLIKFIKNVIIILTTVMITLASLVIPRILYTTRIDHSVFNFGSRHNGGTSSNWVELLCLLPYV